METREELLEGLNDAATIIGRLADIQQRLNKVRSQYRKLLPNKKLGKLAKGFLGIIAIACIYCVFTALIQFNIWSVLFNLFEAAVVFGVFRAVNILQNKKIDSDNQKIDARNQELMAQEQPIVEELQQIQVAYRERLSAWYPENYCYVEAAEFFYDTVKNYRADSLKEAINLYENTLHQRRVEDNQKQAIKQQKLNNLLSVGSIVMQGATLGEISRQNAAIDRNTSALNDINRKIRG